MIVDPITEDTVFERLRAALATQGMTLHRGTLDGMADDKRGRFFVTRDGTADGAPAVAEYDIDIERRARAMGVLQPNEGVVPAHGEGR